LYFERFEAFKDNWIQWSPLGRLAVWMWSDNRTFQRLSLPSFSHYLIWWLRRRRDR
jgi:hypothetical protein